MDIILLYEDLFMVKLDFDENEIYNKKSKILKSKKLALKIF